MGRSEFTLCSSKDTCYIICKKKSVMCSESVYEFVIVSFIPRFLEPFIHLLHIIGIVTCLQNFSNVASCVCINHSVFTKKPYILYRIYLMFIHQFFHNSFDPPRLFFYINVISIFSQHLFPCEAPVKMTAVLPGHMYRLT